MPALRYNPVVSYKALAAGLLLLLAGYGLYLLFSPSPHGYLETFFAMPVFGLGLATCGLAFLLRRPTHHRPWYWLGGILVLLGLSPVLLLVWLSWQ